MPAKNKRQIAAITVIYWSMLLYILSALVWWYISLERQSRQIEQLKLEALKTNGALLIDVGAYYAEVDKIKNQRKRDTAKHMGEGLFFMLLLIISAAYIFRNVRRRIMLHNQQQNFLMAVTHELATPISVSKLNIETLQRHTLAPEKQSKLLLATQFEMHRLSKLINDILFSSQLEDSSKNFAKEELDFAQLVADCCIQAAKRYPDYQFDYSITPQIALIGDALLLQLLINNLLENAVKYSPNNKTITIGLQAKNNKAILTVADNGIGIAKSEHKNIFKKFYRIGSESTRSTKGTGLGLYLCYKITRYHNGTINVNNQMLAGAKFTVTLNRIIG